MLSPFFCSFITILFLMGEDQVPFQKQEDDKIRQLLQVLELLIHWSLKAVPSKPPL